MSNIKISEYDQFLHEVLTWDRSLNFYKQENNFLKTRLSKVLDNNSDKKFLDFAEQFNSNFLFMDDYIKDVRTDLNLQMGILRNYILGNYAQLKSLENFQKKLRNEMAKFEKNMTALKYDFNQRLAAYLDAN